MVKVPTITPFCPAQCFQPEMACGKRVFGINFFAQWRAVVMRLRAWRNLVLVVVYLTCKHFVVAADEPNLNKDQIEQFLLNAKVVGSRHTSKGVTSPWPYLN